MKVVLNKKKEQLNLGVVMHWVDVKKELPIDMSTVLVCLKNGAVTEANFCNGIFTFTRNNVVVKDHNPVSFWMNTPEPPCA